MNTPSALDKLPPFNNDWNQELRLAWFEAYKAACLTIVNKPIIAQPYGAQKSIALLSGVKL